MEERYGSKSPILPTSDRHFSDGENSSNTTLEGCMLSFFTPPVMLCSLSSDALTDLVAKKFSLTPALITSQLWLLYLSFQIITFYVLWWWLAESWEPVFNLLLKLPGLECCMVSVLQFPSLKIRAILTVKGPLFYP